MGAGARQAGPGGRRRLQPVHVVQRFRDHPRLCPRAGNLTVGQRPEEDPRRDQGLSRGSQTLLAQAIKIVKAFHF